MGNERTVTNVAPGVNGTDAVNVDQLDEAIESAKNWSKNYVDQRFESVDRDLNRIGNRANAGVASAIAMASLPQACRAVLDAPSPPSAQAAIFNGGSSMPVAAAAPAEAAPVPDAGAPFAANAFAETPKIGVPLPRPRPGS